MEQPSKLSILKQYFGYGTFREGQEQLIDSILAGKDCLGVMPTGAGKSLCFQVPALMCGGITLVISPLISLMKDQVNALAQAGVKAAYINSSLSERQVGLAINNACAGVYKIIYAAPERLETAEFMDFARGASISMVTVDEAHCISQWGQDFRPSYLRIADFLANLPERPVVSAFTATATPQVRDDIQGLLGLREPTVLVTGFNRANLFFSVEKPDDKFTALSAFLSDKKEKSGIIYCVTRKAVEEVCGRLNALGYSAARYHAGLSDQERRDNQDDFLYDRVRIMTATNAFGMGIDKSNVSFVVHYNMPKNIESYYQEAGRAGRDGGPAECVLLYSGQDVRTNLYMIENNKDVTFPDAETEKTLKELDRQRLKAMTFYCHTSDCLRAYLLKYFGEHPAGYCGSCGSCLAKFEEYDVTADAQKILSCVIKSGERYGVTTVIDTLRGSKSEKIIRLGLDRLSTYGICETSEKRLRDIVNALVLNETLLITDDQYPVVKRGPLAAELLRPGARLTLKLPNEDLKDKPAAKAARPQPVNKALYEKLKTLRMKIAGEQGVPAFVIFADSSLTDMCIKMPADDEAFLSVSGVGRVKLERYGRRFLEAIAAFQEEAHGNAGGNQLEPGDAAAENQEVVSDGRAAVSMIVETSPEAVTVSVIADRINCILLQMGMKKLTGAKINEWLLSEEYLSARLNRSGREYKTPTEKGAALGITREERLIRGVNCWVNYFNEDAQRFIAARFSPAPPPPGDKPSCGITPAEYPFPD